MTDPWNRTEGRIRPLAGSRSRSINGLQVCPVCKGVRGFQGLTVLDEYLCRSSFRCLSRLVVESYKKTNPRVEQRRHRDLVTKQKHQGG